MMYPVARSLYPFWRAAKVFFTVVCLVFLRGMELRAAAPEPLTVYTGFSLNEIRIGQEDYQDDGVFLRGRVDFWWDAAKDLTFDPRDMELYNGLVHCRIREVTVTETLPPPKPGLVHRAFVIDGDFKAYNDYVNFPFDNHEVGVVISFKHDKNSIKFVCPPGYIGKRIIFSSLSSGLRVSGAAFHTGDDGFRYSAPADDQGREEAFFGVTFEVGRYLLPCFVRIFFPMLIIWGLAYMGYFWRDSSPASRCGSSAMIAAVALSLGVRSMIPGPEYLMAINVGFLGLYACIAFDTLANVLVFSLREKRPDLAEKVRRAGVCLSPLILCLIVFVCWNLGRAEVNEQFFSGQSHGHSVNLDEED